MLTTQSQVRAAFWRDLDANAPEIFARRHFANGRTRPVLAPQNYQPADIRMAFVDYIDLLARSGEISQALAARVTL